MNGSHYPQLIADLQNQSLPREAFEIVVADVFDRIAPAAMETADTVIALGQSEYLHNRNAALNVALARANGRVVAFFDRDCALNENALEQLQALFEDRDDSAFMVVCSAPGSLDTSLSHAAGLIEIAACHA